MTGDSLERLTEIPDPFAGGGSSVPMGIAAVSAVPSPTRARVQAMRALALVGALLWVLAWPLLIARRPDLASLPASQMVLGLAVPLAAGVLAAFALGLVGGRGFGPSRGLTLGAVLASPAVFAVATWIAAGNLADDRSWRSARVCMTVASVLTVGPLLLAVVAFRRAFATLSGWRTAALGVVAGAIAAAAMSIVCPVSGAWHVVVGHGATMVLAGMLGAALGRRVCRS